MHLVTNTIQISDDFGVLLSAIGLAFLIGFFVGRISKPKKIVVDYSANDQNIDLADDISKIRATKTFERGGQETFKTVYTENDAALNFERIGTASTDIKDNLKSIKGVGTDIEKQLNSMGIYTFNQISNFNNNDIAEITQSLKFFPGRIERDDWIGQAFNLLNNSK